MAVRVTFCTLVRSLHILNHFSYSRMAQYCFMVLDLLLLSLHLIGKGSYVCFDN